MRYDYKKCPHCGASLDIGETCECQKDQAQADDELKPALVQFCKYPARGNCQNCHHCITSWEGYTTCDMQTEQERIDWLLQSFRAKFSITAS